MNTEAKVFSCGIVVTQNKKYLMLRGWGNWCFPKGKADPDELPITTALRETYEEIGLTSRNLFFRWGPVYFESGPYGRYDKISRYYIAEAISGVPQILPNPETGKTEHDEYKWMTYGEAISVTRPRVRKILKWARQMRKSGFDEAAFLLQAETKGCHRTPTPPMICSSSLRK